MLLMPISTQSRFFIDYININQPCFIGIQTHIYAWWLCLKKWAGEVWNHSWNCLSLINSKVLMRQLNRVTCKQRKTGYFLQLELKSILEKKCPCHNACPCIVLQVNNYVVWVKCSLSIDIAIFLKCHRHKHREAYFCHAPPQFRFHLCLRNHT